MGHNPSASKRVPQQRTLIVRSVIDDGGETAGHASVFGRPEKRQVTYWIGRKYGQRSRHHRASVRVLEKCEFVLSGNNRDFANSRGGEVDEVLFALFDRTNARSTSPQISGHTQRNGGAKSRLRITLQRSHESAVNLFDGMDIR